jgi:hypothetical protein
MTDDEREDLAATLIAHELLLKFLVANLLRLLPLNERSAFIEAIMKMPDLEIPAGIAKDFDSADRLAGVAQKVKQQMRNIVAGVVGEAPSPD